MRHPLARLVWPVFFLAIFLMAGPPAAFAQGGGAAATLTGLVVDAQGGVIPGADVVVKSNATGAESRTVSDSTGHFVIAGLAPGGYTVKVSLMGFKTFSAPDVTIISGTPASIKATLAVGALEETVVVTGATEIVQTQSATVQTTLQVQQIQQLPAITRTALDYVVSLPGVNTPGSNTRSSTINGLPGAAINITLDGINVQDMRSHEGFFMYIRPMMDSVEEITVSTSNPGAESSGSGAANIRMQTRSGSNRFSGSIYDTWRNQAGTTAGDAITRNNKRIWLWGLNSPYWFNKAPSAYAQPKTAHGEDFINDVRLTTPGFRVGGPIFKDKLFYFFNIEQFLLPDSRQRTRYVLNDSARAGNIAWTSGGTLYSFNVLTYMVGKGLTTSTDPTIVKLLADIAGATTTTGVVGYQNENENYFTYTASAQQKRTFPTLRLDYNITNAHRLTLNGRLNKFNSTPDQLNSADPKFPGFPNQGGQVSDRYMWQASLRSTIGKSMVNQFQAGSSNATKGGTMFGFGVTPAQFNCSGIGCQAVPAAAGDSRGTMGWNLNIGLNIGGSTLTTATGYGTIQSGVASTTSFEDNLTWLKGKHSFAAGVAFTRTRMRNDVLASPYYTTLGFGTTSTQLNGAYIDPAYQYLTTAALQAAYPTMSSNAAGYAANLYGLLTGRVTSMSGTSYLQADGSYAFNGEYKAQTTADDWGLYVSDTWRIKPNLTATLGLRYQVQLPMTTDGLYSRPAAWQQVYGITGAGSGQFGQGNLFHPGVLTGQATASVVPYENGRSAYNTDWNNLAPSVGLTWRPNLKGGFLSTILSTDPVFRGGYSYTYTKLGTSFFDSNYSGNPGRSRSSSRGTASGIPWLGQTVVGGTQVFPVLLKDTGNFTPGYVPAISYPITPSSNETLDIHYPNWPVPGTHQYSFGFQRELGKKMAVDIRYVGNTNVGGWSTISVNSSANWSMLAGENGFYDEFRKAQANLRANMAAGLGTTFKYTGIAGTSPLPIFMAYLQGVNPGNTAINGDPTKYTAAEFANSSWNGLLSMYAPSLTGAAGTSYLQNGIGTCGTVSQTGYDCNRIAAGLPINFFMANPAMYNGNAYLETTSGNTKFNSIAVDLTRRMSQGLLIQASYQFQFGNKTYTQRSQRENWFYIPSTGGPIHALKANWVYELPFGRGKKFGNGASRWLDMAIGGWEFDGVARIQSGTIFNFGGYRLVGMNEKDLQSMFKLYHVMDANGKDRVYMLPMDVIQNSMIALSSTAYNTSSGYTGNVLPTGRYLATSSSPDCVQYMTAQCPGTTFVRKITGPMYWKVDLSLVKRITVIKNVRIEARMDVFNVFDSINFIALGVGGSSLSSWEVTSAQTDSNGSQDPGGRITSFGLRISW